MEIGATTHHHSRQLPSQSVGLSPELHCALAAQVLLFLIETGQLEQVRMDKGEFYRTNDRPAPALVLLDAVHTYEETKLDIQWARSVSASIICGHSERFPGVIQAVDEFGHPTHLRGSLWAL